MRMIKSLVAACVAVLALGAANASAAPTCGLSNGKAATGAPIVIGADVTASGGADMSNAPKGAKAYFDCVNANGGINGRPIQYTWVDDQTRPDKAAENAKKLVEDDKAVALVGRASIVDCIATANISRTRTSSRSWAPRRAALLHGAKRRRPECGAAIQSRSGGRLSGEEPAHQTSRVSAADIPGRRVDMRRFKTYADLAGIKFTQFTFDQTSPTTILWSRRSWRRARTPLSMWARR